jgi:hypothetical protein
MAERYFDEDPRATVPIVSGSNFAQFAIGRTTEPPLAFPVPNDPPPRPRRRIGLILFSVLVALLVAGAAAVVSYAIARPH